MSDNCNKTDFPRLDSRGIEYHRWVSDVEIAFIGKNLLMTITGPPSGKSAMQGTLTISSPSQTGETPTIDVAPTDAQKAQALGYLRHHIDPELKWEYIHVKNPRELWNTLRLRFSDVTNVILPKMKAEWIDLCFIDFKSVGDYNSSVLKLRANLDMCNEKLSEADLLEKTLSTFPISAREMGRHYRWEISHKRITTFAELINTMLEAENQDELLVQQSNSRPAGTKRVPETNFGSAPKQGKFMHKGNGSGKKPRHRGPPKGRGANKWKREGYLPHGNSSASARQAPPKMVGPACSEALAPPPAHAEGTYSRCGYIGHFYRHCKATKEVAKAYKAYKDIGPMQVHNVEVDHVEVAPNSNLSIDDIRLS